MKKILMIFACISYLSGVNAQEGKDIKNQLLKILQNKQTSFQKFEGELGNQIKFRDYKIPGGVITGNSGYSDIYLRVRHFAKANRCYLILSELRTKSEARIDYNDLLEINKNLSILMNEAPVDCKELPEYLQNEFNTRDDLNIGYYIETNKITWYIVFGWNEPTIIIGNIASMREKLQQAQLKIEALLSDNY